MQTSMFQDAELRKPLSQEAYEALRERGLACRKCKLAPTSCSQVVFGIGKISRPPVAFVGEGPGKDEDLSGVPFVGQSGAMLDRLIKKAGFTREEIYICNAVNCRPPGNRKPEKDELAACYEWLQGQLHAVQPKTILALGATAANVLLGKKKEETLSSLRGKWFDWQGIPVRVTWHPSFLIRTHDVNHMKETWVDMQAVLLRIKETP
jgi:uracil-DNA glycosylase